MLFKTQLQHLERQAGESASLCCETTKPGACVVWRFGDRVVASSSKYHLKQEGAAVELVIYKLQGADSGEYSCDTGSQRTSAVLTVRGRSFSIEDCPFFMHHLESSRMYFSPPTHSHDVHRLFSFHLRSFFLSSRKHKYYLVSFPRSCFAVLCSEST